MTLVGISNKTWNSHSFSKFLEHFGKMYLYCDSSLHLNPREIKCKI
jgi:hypothetical protein